MAAGHVTLNPYEDLLLGFDGRYGAPLLRHWTLDPDTRCINHGAFGATPRLLQEEQSLWRRDMERNPARFFMVILPGLLRDTAARIAPFFNTAPDRLVFVENASAGQGAVMRSLDFAPGDEILTTDHVYNALRNTALYIGARTGARLVEAPLSLPVQGPEAVLAAIQGGITPRTRLVAIDHVASASALEFPVAEIVALCHEKGIPVLVDGAHGPGLLDLDIDALGADWYVGNGHKWLCAPKGAAILVTSPRAPKIHPLVISHAYGQGIPAEFDKVGTRDPSPWLCMPLAIRLHQALGGPLLRERNRRVAAEVAAVVAREGELVPAGPPGMCHAMVALAAPDAGPATRERAMAIHAALYDKHRFEAAVTTVRGVLHLRISVHAYNQPSDFDGLGRAFRAALADTRGAA